MHIDQLFSYIINVDSIALGEWPIYFECQLSGLSPESGLIHRCTILGSILTLVRNTPTNMITDHVLYRLVDVIESIQEF